MSQPDPAYADEMLLSDEGREAFDDYPYPKERRSSWPWILFFLTILSTIWVAVADWAPSTLLDECLQSQSVMPFRRAVLANWPQGLLYSFYLLLILVAHELGHFLVAKWYRVPATAPIFLPFPINFIGTMGAVIAMRGHEADRKQIFDIGIAGPLAGLVLAIPIAFLGAYQLDRTLPASGGIGLEVPLGIRWLIQIWDPSYSGEVIWLSQLNPAFMAAWVAFLVTGMNMMPVSQLDGGHVTYGLFGRFAHWIGSGVLMFGIAYMVYKQTLILMLMIVLIILMGPHHPPTRDDSVKIGWPRYLLGLGSLVIPILCFPPGVFRINL